MKEEMLQNLYNLYCAGADYCTSFADELDMDEFRIVADEDTFVEDLMFMSAFAIAADGKVDNAEIEKSNELIESFGYEASPEGIYELVERISEGVEFPVPEVLIVLAFCEKLRRIEENPVNADEVEPMLHNIDFAISVFTDIMCSLVANDKLSKIEKQVITDCMEKCVEYVSEELSYDYAAKAKYKQIIDMYC